MNHVGLMLAACLVCSAAQAEVKYIYSDKETFPISDAVKVGNVLYLSGKIAYDASTGGIAKGGVVEETKKILNDIEALLKANGYAKQDIVKCTAMLADIKDAPAFNSVYAKFFEKPYPARSAFGVGGLVLGAKVELECMAAKSG